MSDPTTETDAQSEPGSSVKEPTPVLFTVLGDAGAAVCESDVCVLPPDPGSRTRTSA